MTDRLVAGVLGWANRPADSRRDALVYLRARAAEERQEARRRRRLAATDAGTVTAPLAARTEDAARRCEETADTLDALAMLGEAAELVP